jgi:sugar phosphate isomerase/epimerase
MYAPLLEFAKGCGVRIATENMWNWDREKNEALPAACSHHEDFLRHLLALDDPAFVACLDIGHAEMRGLGTTAVDMIRTLGPRLAALHVHDNDLHLDSHAIPFSMQIDFAAVKKALDEIGYAGYYTLEADQFLAAYDESNVKEGIRLLAEAAKRIEQL